MTYAQDGDVIQIPTIITDDERKEGAREVLSEQYLNLRMKMMEGGTVVRG